ncbi:hypothetical protein GCM10008019_28270 [Deinococcus soli (ex Cha et al. 2016)]|nr:hypothetical protein GCM10008019_28270 [Deinococcus soli (ex Cha et al. 2016)]
MLPGCFSDPEFTSEHAQDDGFLQVSAPGFSLFPHGDLQCARPSLRKGQILEVIPGALPKNLARPLTVSLALPLLLAACSTASVPTQVLVNNPDGSVTYLNQTFTPAQIQARAAALDAQFQADTQRQLSARVRGASLAAQAVTYAPVSKAVAFRLTTGYNDDCFYLNLAVMKVNPALGLGNAEYVSANSTRVMWWRVKGYATLNTTVSNAEQTDLSAACVSAASFFGGKVEQGRSAFRVWAPPATSAEVALFDAAVPVNYGVIRSGETEYANQGYSRAVSYQQPETAVGVAPAYWSRTY